MKNYDTLKGISKELKKGCRCQNSYWKKDICVDGNLCDDCGLKLEDFQKTKELFKKEIERLDKKLRSLLYLNKKGKGRHNDDLYELIEELLKDLEEGE